MAETKLDTSQETLVELKKISLLLSTLVKCQLAPVLEAELHDKTRRTIYEMTGTKTVKEIAAEINMAVGTVSQAWSRWEQLGLVFKDGKSYRKTLELD